MIKKIAILGSTGSIGVQTLEVIDAYQDIFAVEVLTAKSNADLLISQAIKYKPNAVVITDENQYEKVKQALWSYDIKVYTGDKSVEQIVEMDTIDLVLVALVGFSGLKPTHNAIQHKKTVALANKETLVAGGELITKAAHENMIDIIPVDSEHSAIFQCLNGERYRSVETVTITASGGPFLGKNKDQLTKVSPQQALNHPKWTMGNKVTIDSATLMNKGLEMIEAKWLFDLSPSQINVSIHPQSIVHSLVHFNDGCVKAQLSLPNMRYPIQYALSYPVRFPSDYKKLSLSDYASLTFSAPDIETFRCLPIAYYAIEKGGNIPCSMNAANEVAVSAFLEERLTFLQIADVIEQTIQKISYIATPSIEDYVVTDKESRLIASNIINKQKYRICQH